MNTQTSWKNAVLVTSPGLRDWYTRLFGGAVVPVKNAEPETIQSFGQTMRVYWLDVAALPDVLRARLDREIAQRNETTEAEAHRHLDDKGLPILADSAVMIADKITA